MSLRAMAALARTTLARTTLALALGGCATVDAPYRSHLESRADRVRECAEWYRQLDERIDTAGVRDAQDTRVAGFPYLRVNRLLAALRPLAAASPLALQALADRMLLLDLDARRFELRNLPLAPAEDSSHPFGLRVAMERTAACGRLLQEVDLADPESRAALLAHAEVPDDYVLAHRILGLYALTRRPFAAGVRRYEAEVRAAFAREPAPPAGATLLRYDPPRLPRPMPRSRASAIIGATSDNALGIPEPTEADLAELLLAHAPSLEIEVATDADRFGALRWLRGEPAPGVEGAELAVYAHPAWTRYGSKVLLQLVYTIWFPERPPQTPADLLAGRIDGVTWRVTLAPDGEPLVYDTIHPCGCFHLFFPTPRAAARPAPDPLGEWAFAPQSLPRIAEGERPLLRIATRTHYVERVSVVRRADGLVRYDIRPYAELRSLQSMGGGRRSAFGADGLMPGTERPERRLFWPMGIRSAGAMRQWGRQATAFVGRRHFDDPDLLEKRFVLDLGRPQ
jgi:hypothetical protein